ncbi:MAG TPA: hypothetical protein PK156_18355 [Polyangium sp.]|nr:hypothetical protein [Polyangium sp.]
MSTSDRGYFAPLSHDLRVRERLLAAGVITPAEIQQYLAELPDHEGHCETLGIGQPALNTPQPPAPAPALPPIRVSAPVLTTSSSASQAIDDDDDDDEDDDDEDDDDLQASESKPDASSVATVEAFPAQTIAVGEPNPSGAAAEADASADAHKAADAAAEEAAVDAAKPDVVAQDEASEPVETKSDEATNPSSTEQAD